ncbi:MAG TPA: hypothetical protein VJJ47_02625 [Candidatus Paceibacterota bacterium]
MKDEYVRRFAEIHEKETGEKLSEPEARDAAERLVGLFEILFECAKKEARREARLRDEPGGFPVDGHYSCLLCGTGITPETGWYDRWGAKCPPCRRAVDSGAVPGYACRDSDSRHTLWELQDRFGLKSPTARKLVRQGTLVARATTDENGRPLTLIFLKRENPTFAAADPKRPTAWRKSLRRISEKRAAAEKRKWRDEWRERQRSYRLKL